MEFLDGYQSDNLEMLPMEVLEDVIIRMRSDSYLSDYNRRGLLRDYLDERQCKLNKQFVYTDENIKRIEDMNNLLAEKVMEATTICWNIYKEQMELKNSGSEMYRPVQITPVLEIPSDLYYNRNDDDRQIVFTTHEAQLWSVMVENLKLSWNEILPGTAILSPEQDVDISLEDYQNRVLWGSDYNEAPEICSWGSVMRIDYEKTKHICFNWASHNLIDFCGMAIQDVLKIDKFNLKMKFEYDEI